MEKTAESTRAERGEGARDPAKGRREKWTVLLLPVAEEEGPPTLKMLDEPCGESAGGGGVFAIVARETSEIRVGGQLGACSGEGVGVRERESERGKRSDRGARQACSRLRRGMGLGKATCRTGRGSKCRRYPVPSERNAAHERKLRQSRSHLNVRGAGRVGVVLGVWALFCWGFFFPAGLLCFPTTPTKEYCCRSEKPPSPSPRR